MNAWSNLPNANHIDAVLASANANPEKWSAAWWIAAGAVSTEAWNAAHRGVRELVSGEVWTIALRAAHNTIWDMEQSDVRIAARNASWDAILALLAYDDSAHLLNTNPEHVKMLAGIGNEAAILLYPATLVFSEMKNECLV